MDGLIWFLAGLTSAGTFIAGMWWQRRNQTVTIEDIKQLREADSGPAGTVYVADTDRSHPDEEADDYATEEQAVRLDGAGDY